MNVIKIIPNVKRENYKNWEVLIHDENDKITLKGVSYVNFMETILFVITIAFRYCIKNLNPNDYEIQIYTIKEIITAINENTVCPKF